MVAPVRFSGLAQGGSPHSRAHAGAWQAWLLTAALSVAAIGCTTAADFEGYKHLSVGAAGTPGQVRDAGAARSADSALDARAPANHDAAQRDAAPAVADGAAHQRGDAASAADDAGAELGDAAAHVTCKQTRCDPAASCSDSTGTPVCTCPAGYTDPVGDGKQCTDINECASATPPACDVHASCVNTPGSAHCTCAASYNGSGLVCQQNVLCPKGNECSSLASCQAISQTKFCVCHPGYEGDGVTCTDINECLTNNGGCGSATYWTCANNTGAAPSCTDINECLTNNGGCGGAAYVTCVNKVGGAPTCTDVLECASNNGGCSTSPMATCTEQYAAAPTCTCPVGYARNGLACMDIDECTSGGGNNCGANATCTNTPGSFSCACNCGYSGNGVTCTPASTTLGYPTAFTGSSNSTANYVIGFRVYVSTATRLWRFGAINQGPSAPNFRMGLYADSASGPGALVAQSPATSLIGGDATYAVLAPNGQSGCIQLNGGTYYWLMALADANYNLGSNTGGAGIGYRFFARSFSSGLPDPAPASSPQSTPAANLYIVVE
ncbi:MAG TPA: EGF domain-containing protein [Polyangiales bacterium]